MSVLTSYFNQDVPSCPPVTDDYLLQSKLSPEGEEITVPEKFDYSEVQRSNGNVADWSIANLTRAGIDPRSLSPVHTTAPTQYENFEKVDGVLNDIPEIVEPSKAN